MAAEDDKIKYRDIIEPDDSIEKLIKQISELNKSYESMIGVIKSGADKIEQALKAASGATNEGRKEIDEASIAADRLNRAYKELKFALSNTGKQVAWLKAQTVDANKATVEQQRYIKQAISSYDRLKSELKQHVTLYKSLTEAERADSQMGQQVLQTILNLKTQIAALDAQMKPHIETLTEVQKAEQKLAFLQSEEGQKLLDLKAKIAAVTAARRQQKAQLTELEKAKLKLKQAQSDENVQLKLYTTQVREANQIAKLQAQIANSAEGSYNRLAAQYALNKIQLNAMSAAEREAANSGKKLESETKAIYEQMIKLQEATGNYRLSVGHYEKTWNRLGFSVVQVVRELPAAAVSLNTFFLGISNNIPMVIDEVNRLRAQNKALAAEGKPTVSITKSITKALFGWNTALVVVLTTFSMFGKQILSWIDRVLSGRSAVLSVTEAMETLNAELAKNSNGYGNEITILRRLSDEWKRLGSSVKDQQQWIKDNQTEFGKLDITINDVNTASRVFVDNTEAFIEALKARAKAQAALNILSEKTGKLLELENKAEVEKTKDYGFFDKTANYFKAFWAGFSGPDKDLSFSARLATQRQRNIDSINEDKDALQESIDNYFKVYQFYIDKTDELYEELGLEGKHKKEKEKAKREPRMLDTEDTLESLSLAATKAYQKSVTELEREEIKKRRKEYLEAYNVEVADLNKKYNKIQRILDGQDVRYKKLTEEQKEQALKAQDDIAKAIENKEKEAQQNIGLLYFKQLEQEAERQLDILNLQIEAAKKGSEEEYRLRLKALSVEEQIALARNAQLPQSQQVDPNLIKASFTKQKGTAIVENLDTEFGQKQALKEAEFNAEKHTEKEITRFKLEQEKERWQRQIALAEAGILDWSQLQIDAAKATVRGIDRELSELDNFLLNVGEKGLGSTVLERLGFNDKQINALKDAADIVIEQFSAILDAEVELAEKEKELADERVERAQAALDAEIEARNNGYANNVDTARKELELERKNQLQKQKILAEAQRRQQALDSVTQASSLVTASANIWASFSKMGIIGPALAIAAIATMWGSFAAAKIKAKQVTAVQEEQQYGEGGLEFLEGGSHASGNDIDLGVSNKKKRRMKAEGGEALAIVNKKNTRRYRRILPDVINSLNKGIFEEKYLSSFNGANDLLLNASVSKVDLTSVESLLMAIKNQGDLKTVARADGAIVEISKGKNIRIIKP